MLSNEQVKQAPIKYCVNAVRDMNQPVYEYRIFSRQLGDVCILVYANNIQEVLYYVSPDSTYTPQPKREVTSLQKDRVWEVKRGSSLVYIYKTRKGS